MVVANYKHSILGDPLPGAGDPSVSASPQSSRAFLRALESPPSHSSAIFVHPTIDHKLDSSLEYEFNGSTPIVAEFTRKLPTDKRVYAALPESATAPSA